jgi:hypothetical protein
MRRETYHLSAIHEPPGGDPTPEWVHACLANARAAFLQQLGLTSARLRAEGLRLGFSPEGDALPATIPVTTALGITLTLRSAGDAFAFTERLYDASEQWQPFWHGVTRVWAEAQGQRQSLPCDLVQELAAWLHLGRGTVPVASASDEQLATGS